MEKTEMGFEESEREKIGKKQLGVPGGGGRSWERMSSSQRWKQSRG